MEWGGAEHRQTIVHGVSRGMGFTKWRRAPDEAKDGDGVVGILDKS